VVFASLRRLRTLISADPQRDIGLASHSDEHREEESVFFLIERNYEKPKADASLSFSMTQALPPNTPKNWFIFCLASFREGNRSG
jgi:hypothetical protein